MRVLTLPVIAAALLLSSCGAAGPQTAPSTSPSKLTTTFTGPPPHVAPGPTPGTPVGVAQRAQAKGTALTVNVTKVIDPLVGSGAKVQPGMVPVGVVINVHNAGPGGYDSSATSDFALRTAAGRAMPVYAPNGACQTYIQDFMNELGPGQSRTGCIAYQVPHGKPPTSVTLAPDGGTAHSSVSWVVQPAPVS